MKFCACRTSLGFTVGAMRILLTCIANIKRLVDEIEPGQSMCLGDEVKDLCCRLEENQQVTSIEEKSSVDSTRVFYFYDRLYLVTP